MMQYAPSHAFCTEISNVFRQIIVTKVNMGQMSQDVANFCYNEFNTQFSSIANTMFDKAQRAGRALTPQEISMSFEELIRQMVSKFQTRPLYGQQPMYGQPYGYGPVYPQQQSIFSTGVGQPQTLQTTGYAQSQVHQTSIYSTPTPQVPAQPTQSAQPAAQQPAPAEAVVKYNPPAYRDECAKKGDGIALDLKWAKCTDHQFIDEMGEPIDVVLAKTDRGFLRPKDAVQAVVDRLKGNIARKRMVVVNYGQIVAYNLPRGTTVKAFAELKNIVKNVNSSHKHGYLKNIIKYITEQFNRNDSNRIEEMLLYDFNHAVMHGALFDSDTLDDKYSFSVKTLQEIVDILDPDSNVAKPDERFNQTAVLNQLTVLARTSVLNAIRNIEIVDPNTPEGLDEYLSIYGDVAIDGYLLKDIRKYQMEAATKKDKSAAQDVVNKLMSVLNSQTVVKFTDKTAVYSTMPLANMISENYTVQCGPMFIGGPDPAETHTEYFLTRFVGTADIVTYSLFFQPTPNMMFAYSSIRTTDNWMRLVPARLS